MFAIYLIAIDRILLFLLPSRQYANAGSSSQIHPTLRVKTAFPLGFAFECSLTER